MKIRMLMCTVVAAAAPGVLLMSASGAALAQTAPMSRTVTPVIQGFTVQEVARLNEGAQLSFTLYGTAGATVTLAIDGANRNLHLDEVEPGQYSGTYVIGNRDRLAPDSVVSAEMKLGNQSARSRLGQRLVRADVPQPPDNRGKLASRDGESVASAPGAHPPPPPRATERPRMARYCTSCAIVEKVEIVQGPVANPRPLASQVTAQQHYRVTVKFNTDERVQALEYDNNPGYKKGDRVRVNDGVLSLEPDQ